MSKFSIDVLRRCVFPFAESSRTDVILGATFGEDVALTSGLCVRRGGNETTYSTIRCEDDELARMWALYPPNE